MVSRVFSRRSNQIQALSRSEQRVLAEQDFNTPTPRGYNLQSNMKTMRAMGGLFGARVIITEHGCPGRTCSCQQYPDDDSDHRADLLIYHPDLQTLQAIKNLAGTNAQQATLDLELKSLEIKGLVHRSYIYLGARQELVIWMEDIVSRACLRVFWEAFWQGRTEYQIPREADVAYIKRILQKYARKLGYGLTYQGHLLTRQPNQEFC